ncbi:Pc16g15130 [Penicillium rubens Wisconsin 54-1255]|uniref:Pc16g15130 protein n=1 Tax=Penicillium rubens (strain ATCC 28089 / DSM 1075 / NRRL 1951 / Wisconsin 54-1255) TaxID=500485 RepID=B6HA56_PENRW|nr:Pc16g15130 [Penicillium rubens Wisconsin 54-1255]
MPKRSNEKRLKLNQQCREALAANICTRGPLPTITQLILLDDRLGIVVAPEKVRLQPRPEDGYPWSVTSANASVLKSSLSSGKIHLYRKICNEIGHSIEAVSPHALGHSQSNTSCIPRESLEAESFGDGMDGSFTAEISKLKAANSSIEIELERTHARLNDCLDESHTVRAEANELRHDMQILRSHNKKLHDELTEAKAGIAGARRILNSLQTEGIEIEVGTRDIQSSANGIHEVASEILD